MNKQKLKKLIYRLPSFIVEYLKLCYTTFLFVFRVEYRTEIIRQKKLRERKISKGFENSDKFFYIIRRDSLYSEGHYSMVNYYLGHLKIAEERGLIPVIDMKNYYHRLWQADSNRGKENAWEYFYNQPSPYTLDDICKSKNIILCNARSTPQLQPHQFSYNKVEIQKWNAIYNKYIAVNAETKAFIERMSLILGVERSRVLAVSIRRGIEWGQIQKCNLFSGYSQHPIIDDVINKVKDCMNDWACECIFLAIDDQEGLEIFKNVFSEKLVYIERDRWGYFKNGIPLSEDELSKTRKPTNHLTMHEKELRFLTEVNILARCNSIVCAKTSASASAFLINGNRYENNFIF